MAGLSTFMKQKDLELEKLEEIINSYKELCTNYKTEFELVNTENLKIEEELVKYKVIFEQLGLMKTDDKDDKDDKDEVD